MKGQVLFGALDQAFEKEIWWADVSSLCSRISIAFSLAQLVPQLIKVCGVVTHPAARHNRRICGKEEESIITVEPNTASSPSFLATIDILIRAAVTRK
jgi:hypothetical protein